MIPISKPYIGEAEKQAVLEVLDSGMLVQGPRSAGPRSVSLNSAILGMQLRLRAGRLHCTQRCLHMGLDQAMR